ncbi:hypothetical protein [Methylobacterium aquaticum]|uniref:hypothetical protein n=1 Tax=Methylobacterium aquaticum TaxID=270351 RepID=UPI001FCCFD39|nr:hypothetical protein [Methylobacterium aquaticum]
MDADHEGVRHTRKTQSIAGRQQRNAKLGDSAEGQQGAIRHRQRSLDQAAGQTVTTSEGPKW